MTDTVHVTTRDEFNAARANANRIAGLGRPLPPNTFVFMANFDGTKNIKTNPGFSGDPHSTAIGAIADATAEQPGNIKSNYYSGVGTYGSKSPMVWPTDEATAIAQKAYDDFAVAASNWLALHPNDSVTTMITSFSRGGVSASIFSQMLYVNGLRDPFTGQLLIRPGEVTVSENLMISPVLTNANGNMDLPPNVLHTTVAYAANEYRDNYLQAIFEGGQSISTFLLLGNHGDIGDIYDNPLGGNVVDNPFGTNNGLGAVYLDGYLRLLGGYGLNIGAVDPLHALNDDYGLVHDEPFSRSSAWNSHYGSFAEHSQLRGIKVGTQAHGQYNSDGTLTLTYELWDGRIVVIRSQAGHTISRMVYRNRRAASADDFDIYPNDLTHSVTTPGANGSSTTDIFNNFGTLLERSTTTRTPVGSVTIEQLRYVNGVPIVVMRTMPTNPDGSTTTLSYDDTGTQVIDSTTVRPNGDYSEIIYSNGAPAKVVVSATDAQGTNTVTEYSVDGTVLSRTSTARTGSVNRRNYDPQGNVTVEVTTTGTSATTRNYEDGEAVSENRANADGSSGHTLFYGDSSTNVEVTPEGDKNVEHRDEDGNPVNETSTNPEGQGAGAAATTKTVDSKTFGNDVHDFFTHHSALIGQQLGSALGRYIARDQSAAIQGASAALLGTIGSDLGKAVELSLAGEKNAITTAFADFPEELLSAGIGVISSILTAKLFDSLGIHGTAGELGQSVFSSYLSVVIENIGSTTAELLTALEAVKLGNIVGGFIGAKLAAKLIDFDTVGGQIGAAIGTAIGTAIGAEVGAKYGAEVGMDIYGPIGAAIGAFVGYILGGLIGSLFGGTPRSGADLAWNETTQQYGVGAVWSKSGGAKDAARALAASVSSVLNSVIAATGSRVSNGLAIRAGAYGTRNKDLTYTATGGGGKGEITFKTKDPAALINFGAAIGISDLLPQLVGGDIYVKRAIGATLAQAGVIPNYNYAGAAGSFDIDVLVGNIAIARDYERYLQNKDAIGDLIYDDPNSVFTAGWSVTFARAVEMGLMRRAASDWTGGWSAFLDEKFDGRIDGKAFSSANLEFAFDEDTDGRLTAFFNGDNEFIGLVGDTVDTKAKDHITATSETM